MEICHEIQKLKLESGIGKDPTEVLQDVLFGKFMDLVSLLPSDACNWSVTLCTQYHSALRSSG